MVQSDIRKIIRSEKIVTGIKCDHCGRNIRNTEDYWNVTFSHSDWGVNSADSYEYKDYCSKECLASVFLEYLNESSDSRNNPNTMRMDIERRRYIEDEALIDSNTYEAIYVRKGGDVNAD